MTRTHNAWFYSGRLVCITLFLTLLSNAVLHNQLLERGFSIYQLGLVGIVENISNILCLLLFSGFADSFRSFGSYRRAIVGMMMYLPAKAILIYLLFFYSSGVSDGVFVILYLFLAGFIMIWSTLSGMLDISLLMRAMPDDSTVMRQTGISGIIAGVAGILGGIALAKMQDQFALILAVATAVGLGAVLFTMGIQEVRPITAVISREKPWTSIKNVVQMSIFRKLLPSNLVRGVQGGVAYYIISIGLTRFSEQENMSTLLSGCVAGAPFLSFVLITLLSRRKKAGVAGTLYFLGGIIACGGMLLLALLRNSYLYAAVYFLLLIGETLIDYCYPLGIYEVVPMEALGRFSAVRLLLYMVALMLSVYLFGILIDMGFTVLVFCIGAITALYSGYDFCRVLHRNVRLVQECNI
jgi:hypothetical protein